MDNYSRKMNLKPIFLRLKNDIFKKNIEKICISLIPFIPHLAHECLEVLKSKNIEKWPIIDSNIDDEIKMAVQINGKTREIINVKKDLNIESVQKEILNSKIIQKFLKNKKIFKTIFVKNKIINYIIK